LQPPSLSCLQVMTIYMTGSTYELAELESREALAATLIFAVKIPCSEHDPSLSTAYWRGYYSNDRVPSYSSKASLPSPEAMRQTSGISDGDFWDHCFGFFCFSVLDTEVLSCYYYRLFINCRTRDLLRILL